MNLALTDRPPRGDAPAPAAAVPASPAQELAWTRDLDPVEAAANVLAVALAFEGPLDPARLGEALGDVVARHAVLRTRFRFEGDRMLQVVEPTVRVPLPVIDLRALPAEAREPQAFRLAREEAARRFDLQQLPLLRGHLYRLESSRHILVLAFHRAVFDESSCRILFEELAAAYDARHRSSSPALPPLPFQYAEHAVRQQRPAAEREADFAWWRARLVGDPPAPLVPADAFRPWNGRTGRRRVEKIELPAGLRDQLLGFATHEGVDPLAVHLAAAATLLQRYGGRADFVLGLRAPARRGPGLERLIGPLTRVLPWRPDLAGDPAFRLLLDRVRSDLREALVHAGSPIESPAARLPAGDARTCPVQFCLEPDPLAGISWPDLQVQLLELPTGFLACTLGLTVAERSTGLTVRAEFDADCHSPASMQRLLGHFGVLLASALARPGTRLSELPLLTDPERRRLVEWNQTATPFPRDLSVPELVSARAAATPGRAAVAAGSGVLSYGELERRSNQLATLLRAAGMRPATVVGVLLESTPDLPVCQLALLKAGGIGLWLDPRRPRVYLDRLVAETRPGFVLTHSQWSEILPSGPARAWELDTMESELSRDGSSAQPVLAAPEDLAWLVPTGGTTGPARIAQLSHRALVCRLHAFRLAPGLRTDDVVLVAGQLPGAPLPLQSFLPLAAGANLVLASPEELRSRPRLELLLARHAVTLFSGTPGDWERLLATGWNGLPGLRLLCTGGPLTRDLADRLRRCGRELWNVYGTAETAGPCLALPLHSKSAGLGTGLGRPLANVQAHVLDARLQPLPAGLSGELFLGGEGIASGYIRDPATTEERFPPDPFRRVPGARLFRTGDIVRRLASGEIDFVRRRDPTVPTAPAPAPAAGFLSSVRRADDGGTYLAAAAPMPAS